MKKVLTIIGIVSFVKLILILAINNTGWEPDSYQHFNEVLTVFRDFPNNLDIGIGVWSKPLYTYPMGIIAFIFGPQSLFALQITNLIIFTTIALLIYKISMSMFKNENIALVQALICTLSLILFESSISALTEPIFTLMLVSGYYFATKKNYYLASILFSLSVLGRIEGLFFVGVFNLWLIWKYRKELRQKFPQIIKLWALSLIPTIIWNFFGYLQTKTPFFIFESGYPTDSEAIYGKGSWTYYFTRMATQEGIVTLLLIISVVVFIKKNKDFKHKDELLLAATLSIGFFITQVITWRFGMFGSAGLMRYFISVLPFMIIFSGIALSQLPKMSFLRSQKSHLLKHITFALLLLAQVTITLLHFIGIGPIESKWIELEHEEFRDAGSWVSENVSKETYLGSERPEVIYYAGRDLQNSTIFPSADFSNRRSGIYAWSNSWGEAVAGITFSSISEEGLLLTQFGYEVFVFEIE